MSSTPAEHELRTGHAALPRGVVGCALVLLGWGAWYAATHVAGFRGDVHDADPAAADSRRPPATSLVLGRRYYRSCAGCHQPDGQGVPGTYPPLADSEWVRGDPDVLTRVVLHGVQGPLVVRGVTYDAWMPPWSGLPDERVAAVLTFIRAEWGASAGPLDAEQVAAIRQQHADRRRPWTADELGGRAHRDRTRCPGVQLPITNVAQATRASRFRVCGIDLKRGGE